MHTRGRVLNVVAHAMSKTAIAPVVRVRVAEVDNRGQACGRVESTTIAPFLPRAHHAGNIHEATQVDIVTRRAWGIASC